MCRQWYDLRKIIAGYCTSKSQEKRTEGHAR